MTIFKKSVSFFLILVFLMSLCLYFPFCASAADSKVNIDNSSVEDDLSSTYVDLSASFPRDVSDDQIYLISFMEYGYDEWAGENGDFYGLYLYIYNPSGKSVLSDTNKVQFAISWKDDGQGNLVADDFYKYNLLKLNSNENNTLIKFKVVDADSNLICKIGGKRRYDISGIELHEKNYSYSDYTVGYAYTFNGYAKGMSNESENQSTLSCSIESFLTLKVEAHQVSYLTGNSALDDEGYSNQVNSVYFSIPSDIEKKYGDLYSIKYEYYHYYTSPMMITDNETSYNTLLADRGKKVDSTWEYGLSYLASYIPGSQSAPASVFNYYYNYGKELEDSLLLYYNYFNSLPFLTTVFYDSNGWSEGDLIVSSSDLESYFKAYTLSYHNGRVFDYSADLFDLSKSKKYVVEEKTIDDRFTLESYKDTHNWFEEFVRYGFTVPDESIDNARFIEKLEYKSLTSTDASSTYLVDEIYLSDLRSFYTVQKGKGNNVYLLRFAAADDYRTLDLESNGLEGNFLMAQGNAYLNFDFIYFTFGDKDDHIVIAAVSDPTDGFFNIVDTTPNFDISVSSIPWWVRFLVVLLIIVVIFIVLINVFPAFGELFAEFTVYSFQSIKSSSKKAFKSLKGKIKKLFASKSSKKRKPNSAPKKGKGAKSYEKKPKKKNYSKRKISKPSKKKVTVKKVKHRVYKKVNK